MLVILKDVIEEYQSYLIQHSTLHKIFKEIEK